MKTDFYFRNDTQKEKNQCRDCNKLIITEYQTKNKDEIKIRIKKYRNKTKNLKRFSDMKYRERSREKIQLYKKNYFQNNKQEMYKKIKTTKDEDIKFWLACNLGERVLNVFKAQNVRKATKTFYLLGRSHSFLKLWIESQLYGEMTLKKHGKIWCLDHCLPIASFILIDDNEFKKSFNWVNLRPMYVKDNIIKGDKIDIRLYLLHEIKGSYFMKLIAEEGQH